jgi:adenosine deaminase
MDKHPFKQLMDFGIVTTVNTDDPTPFHTDMNRECDLLHRQLHLSHAEIEACMNFARLSTFIPKGKVDLVMGKA